MTDPMAERTFLDSPLVQRIAFAIFVLGIAFLAFAAGTAVTWFKLPPFQTIQSAMRGARAAVDSFGLRDPVHDSNLYRDIVYEGTGVTRHVPERAAAGLTFYTSGHVNGAFLIDMDGTVVHQWSLPYSEFWDETAEARTPRPDSWTYFRHAVLLPNGDVIANYECGGITPYGCGLVKLDKDSNVIWKYLRHAHHDVELAPDGRVLTLTHWIEGDPIDLAPDDSSPPYLIDAVAVLSPDGEELQHIDLVEAFRDTSFATILKEAPVTGQGDLMHTNAVEYIATARPEWPPEFKPNSVLISLREVSLLAVLDLESEKITWATRGPWIRQHDPDLLDNGHLLLFDNLGHLGPGGRSRILELDPQTLGIVWSFSGSPAEPFDSEVRGEQERLGNGNTLITDSEAGRLLEVTAEGEVVWEFLNPGRAAEGTRVAVVASGARFDPAELTFLEGRAPIATNASEPSQ
jgi:hypothetical protein